MDKLATFVANFVLWSRNASPTQIVGTLLGVIPVVILALETWASFLRQVLAILQGLAGAPPTPPTP